MSIKIRTNTACTVAAVLLLLTHMGEAGMASAALDQYDPRRDPNYRRETSQTAQIHWEAVWSLVREFEARSYENAARSQSSGRFAVPQPWHYVQESFAPDTTPPVASATVYGGPYGGPFYGYDPWFSRWWGTSPRIPWWSLVPFTTKHHQHHRHQKGTSHHH